MTSPRRTDRRERAFTIIELLIVMFIISMLSVMAVPSFSRLQKTSRLDQAIKAVLSANRQARTYAMSLRRTVSVFYGDDFANINPKPLAGVLPDYGHIEIWTVLECPGRDDCPYMPDVAWGNYWYPYRFKDIPLTSQPITYPDGVRMVTGDFFSDSKTKDFNFWNRYFKDPRGEITRHQTNYHRSGMMPFYCTGSMPCLLVWDTVTGENAVIRIAELYRPIVRPRVIWRNITSFGGVKLNDPRDITKMVDNQKSTPPW